MNARLTLKARTAKAHDRVDELFSRFDLGDEGEYRRFLTAQAEAFLPVEASLDAAGAETVIEDWRSAAGRGPSLRIWRRWAFRRRPENPACSCPLRRPSLGRLMCWKDHVLAARSSKNVSQPICRGASLMPIKAKGRGGSYWKNWNDPFTKMVGWRQLSWLRGRFLSASRPQPGAI